MGWLVRQGICLIINCTKRLTLREEIIIQTAHWITIYTDPAITDIDIVFNVIVILHRLQATDSIIDREWPALMYRELEYLLSRLQYMFHEDRFLYAAYYDSQSTGQNFEPAENIVNCLRIISLTSGNQCNVLALLQRQQQNITMLLQEGDSDEKTAVMKLLSNLLSHSCTTRDCVGGRWAEWLLHISGWGM